VSSAMVGSNNLIRASYFGILREVNILEGGLKSPNPLATPRHGHGGMVGGEVSPKGLTLRARFRSKLNRLRSINQ
jgi:hypothetical protein